MGPIMKPLEEEDERKLTRCQIKEYVEEIDFDGSILPYGFHSFLSTLHGGIDFESKDFFVGLYNISTFSYKYFLFCFVALNSWCVLLPFNHRSTLF